MEILVRAFWHQPGQKITFHLPRSTDLLPKGADNVSGSLLASHNYAGDQSIQVMTTSLDEILEYAGRKECDILKMDIEGAEYEVINHLASSGGLHKVKQLLVEFHHGWTSYTKQDTLDSVSLIQKSGFELIHIEHRNYIFRRL